MLTIHSDEELNPIQFNAAMTHLRWRGVSNLLTGAKYKVTFDDCCVEGWFIDTLKYAHFRIDKDGVVRLDYLMFEHAMVKGWLAIDKVEE